MKKIITILVALLVMSSAVYAAVDITITLTDKQSSVLTKAAAWNGKTRQQIARQAIIDRLEYEREVRKQTIIFQNESSICALHDC